MVLWIAIAGLIAWLSFEVFLRGPGESRRWAGSADAGRSTRFLVGSFFLALAASTLLSVLGVAIEPLAVRWLGCGLLAAGLLLRAWSMSVLGRSYSRGLQVGEQQALVTTGPYRILRHPGYAGTLLVWIGYGLAIGSWAGVVVIAALLGTAYIYRIGLEEHMLASEFGPSYQAYQERTWGLIPGLY